MSFYVEAWGANWVGLAGIKNNTQWRGQWDLRIPNLLDPFCLAWALEAWPDLYGVYESDVYLTLTAGLQTSHEMEWDSFTRGRVLYSFTPPAFDS